MYGGGGNSGAPFRNDFIEIFNAGQIAISLTGWSVQYATANGTSWSVTNLTSVSLAPGQYYLVQEASGGSAGLSLPAPDATGNIAMAATAGKVAMVNTTTALTGSCPSDSSIVDLVGYGNTASCFRGSGPTTAPSNTNAVLRKGNGCTDTRNNVSDFATGPPTPRNTTNGINVCIANASNELATDKKDRHGSELWGRHVNVLICKIRVHLWPILLEQTHCFEDKIIPLNSQRMYIRPPARTARGP